MERRVADRGMYRVSSSIVVEWQMVGTIEAVASDDDLLFYK